MARRVTCKMNIMIIIITTMIMVIMINDNNNKITLSLLLLVNQYLSPISYLLMVAVYPMGAGQGADQETRGDGKG
jgi:hypothetical protein